MPNLCNSACADVFDCHWQKTYLPIHNICSYTIPERPLIEQSDLDILKSLTTRGSASEPGMPVDLSIDTNGRKYVETSSELLDDIHVPYQYDKLIGENTRLSDTYESHCHWLYPTLDGDKNLNIQKNNGIGTITNTVIIPHFISLQHHSQSIVLMTSQYLHC